MSSPEFHDDSEALVDSTSQIEQVQEACDKKLQVFDEQSHAVIVQLLDFLSHLQRSAISPLANQQHANSEVESRKTELATIIAHVTEEVCQGVKAVQAIQTNLASATEGNLERISTDLNGARNTLEERQNALAGVMRELDTIGRQLSMLAMNAKIEASRAGESEAGFSVVADEVKRLARTAIEHSAQASTLFDLTSVTSQLDKLVDNFQDTSSKTETDISSAFENVVNAFSEVDVSLGEVSKHHAVISEVAQGTDANVERSHGRLLWATKRTEQAIDLLGKHTLDERGRSIERLLLSDGIHCAHSFDRLESIRKSGKLRVAIEPSFVGLSFRQKKGDPLQGLDVEYANALASYLNVQCEFVEAPWDTLTELLHTGRKPNEYPADLVLSALPASETYEGVAYSESYTYLNWVLARKVGNNEIRGLADLDGKTLGIINDPGAFDLLQNAGVRWQSNQSVPGGKIFLQELIAFSDQSRIHDCLVEGIVDAFGVDLPIYHWACTDKESPWYGKIETCSDNLAGDPYYYCIAVAALPASYHLLKVVNMFVKEFQSSNARMQLERRWQGSPISHTLSYRDEPGNQLGEAELKHLWDASRKGKKLHLVS